jgi:hypothetical protein
VWHEQVDAATFQGSLYSLVWLSHTRQAFGAVNIAFGKTVFRRNTL